MPETSPGSKALKIAKALMPFFIVMGTLLLILVLLGLVPYVAPLLVALVISFLIDPLVRFLSRDAGRKKGMHGKDVGKRWGLPRRLAIVVSMVLVFSLLIFLSVLVINGLVGEIINFISDLPVLLPKIIAVLENLLEEAQDIFGGFPDQMVQALNSSINALGAQVSTLAGQLAKAVFDLAASLPGIILFVLFSVMGTYFLSVDKSRLFGFFHRNLPPNWIGQIGTFYRTMLSALIGYIKAQLIIMCCIFAVLSIGFTIIGVEYVLLLAAIIAVLDAAPGVGTGLVMIPWIIFNIFMGNYGLGLALMVVYLAAVATRQSIEPRIVAVQIGLHPLLSMGSMYAGLKIFGILGLFVGPLSILIIKYFLEAYFHGRSYMETLQSPKEPD